MSDFKIVRTDDPAPYRDRILSFWSAYLAGTPPGRLDWLGAANPAGPAVWFLAFDRGTGELAGTTSLMRRRLTFGGTDVSAAVMGDFMVADRYRAFGPYLKLLKETTGSRGELGLDCIYTIPNPASRLACMRVGMEKVKDLRAFVRPIAVRFYLEKSAPAAVAAVLSPFVSAGLRLSSRELVAAPRDVREEELRFDESFDELWRTRASRTQALLGDRSARFLSWRYGQNPLFRFRLLTHRGGDGSLGGYAIFTQVADDKLEVYEAEGLDAGIIERLIAAVVRIARRERCRSVYFRAPLSSGTLRIFERFRFLKTDDVLELYYVGRKDIPLDEWDFTSGDRNI